MTILDVPCTEGGPNQPRISLYKSLAGKKSSLGWTWRRELGCKLWWRQHADPGSHELCGGRDRHRK